MPADLATLVDLFYPNPAALGQFAEVTVQAVPPVYRELLAHTSHMTVAMEEHHAAAVDVHVLDKRVTPTHYARKILLSRRSVGSLGDDKIVLYGIVRINFAFVSPEVEAEIRSETTPLGRVLIEHNVLRRVRLEGLWRVEPGAELVQAFRLAEPHTTFGRTALIECNGEPAIELLEIVVPEA
jgi:chorismate-pyruvate lyase